MEALRSDIEKTLEELKSYEEGMKFQGLAVIIAKQIWPELIACERKKDLGVDAYAPSEVSAGRVGKALACSITADLSKINTDAKKIQTNFNDVTTIIFATSEKVTNETAATWIEEIKKSFGYQLIVISREEIIASLMEPKNAPLCRSFGISAPIEANVVESVEKAKKASLKLTVSRLSQAPLSGKPLLPLRSMKLDHEGGETAEILQLHDIKSMLTRGHRIVLEAPAGRGKTTTLVQLADQYAKDGGIALLIDLPAWMMSGKDIIEFTAGLPHFRSEGVDSQALARIYEAEHITFLLNGWNEIADNYSEKALTELQQLERTFPSAGIIVATRTHHLTPPLPGALRVRLLSLNRTQRAEYLKNVLGDRSDTLRSKLDNDIVLDQLTRTPLILSKVADIFSAGLPIPATKIGVLDAVMNLIEQSTEHKNQLQLPPLNGYARVYLSELAMQMLFREEVIIPEQESRPIVGSVSVAMLESGQISTTPEPQAIINALCARHVLERQDYPSVTLRFEHQQFQEFFAALRLKSELLALSRNNDEAAIREFTKRYVNQPVWEESLQMIAQEIGNQETGDSEDTDLAKAGILLVQMALNVDPIFAADLARLCGSSVWNHVRALMSDKLRIWYQSTDPNHRQCALAGMLASGSADFSNVIIPQLISEDHQARLTAYRLCDEFHLSILGSDWKKTVSEWSENARIDFVKEVTQNRWRPEIIEAFVLNDPSIRVRVAAMEWLSWVGYPEDVAHLIEKLDQETFAATISKMSPDEIPPTIRARALTLYQKIYNESMDAVDCLRNLLSQVKLGNTNIENELKKHLNDLDRSKMKDLGEFVIKPSLDIIKKSDPTWVSHWVAERVADGSLWLNHWSVFITAIPEKIMTDWLQKLSSEDLEYQHHSHINELLAVGADKDFTENIFLKLCELKRLKQYSTPDQISKKEHAIVRQLEDLFRALPPNIAVSGLSKCFDSKFDNIEFLVVIDVLNSVGRSEPRLSDILDSELRQKIREYLKGAISFALSEPDSSGNIKAELASCLGRVGEPEDMVDLDRLLQADLKRLKEILKNRIEGRAVTITSQCGHYLKALVQLAPLGAEDIILNLINEPIYDCESASVLVSLAKEDRSDPPFGGYRQGYAKIWDVRAGQNFIEFDETRRINFANAIRERIKKSLEEAQSERDKVPYSIRELGKSLAILDPKGSTDLIFDVLSLLGEHDDWTLTFTLENLLNGGATLPTNKVSDLFDGMLQRLKKYGSHDDRENLLRHFLCILPFIANPEEGIKKIREAITEFRIPLHIQRDIVDALGYSRCDEAYSLLRELAGSNGEYIKDLGESWLNALAALDTVESKKLLMSFVDPDITGFQNMPNIGRTDILASHIATLARNDSNIHQRLIGLCDSVLSAEERSLLAEAISKLDSEDAIMASLNLIDDTANPTIPFSLARKFETSFVERRPHGKSGSTFTLAPRSFNSIRKRLFEMSISDEQRKRTAYALLGKIESWRLDYGKPMSEPRHPDFESGEKWPPHV